MKEAKLFTSESVSMGHPDKVCDQVSDAVLDACLKDDPASRVACECFATTGLVVVGGEIHTETFVDVEKEVRRVLRDIGYVNTTGIGFDADCCGILVTIHEQSADIAQGVTHAEDEPHSLGAGDQGMMFGFACRETPELMPAPILYAHALMKKHAEMRRAEVVDWLLPDAKGQVTFRYEGDEPVAIDTIVLSTQHRSGVSLDEIRAFVREELVPAAIPEHYLHEGTRYHVNPTGRFEIGGPHGDTGLTGRKIIVDTYGGYSRHGGGAFSGKDATKVDRSAAYAARWVAKNLVAAGFAERVEVQFAYAIGVAHPLSIRVDGFGSLADGLTDDDLQRAIRNLEPWVDDAGRAHDPLTPDWIIGRLGLRRPNGWSYRETAYHGHFGREEFPWESLDLVPELQAALDAAATSRS